MNSDIVKVAILSSLVPSSLLKRAGDLRYKTEKEVEKGIPDFNDTLEDKLKSLKEDIVKEETQLPISPILICGSAFNLKKIPNLKLDGVITSPPYVNGTNYIRNTKLELWYLGCLREKKDLKYLREKSLTAGINSVNGEYSSPDVESVRKVVNELEKKAYDNRIPKMISGYFSELQEIFFYIRKHLNDDSLLAIDIGDSKYAGVLVPTDKLLVDSLREIKYNYIETIKLRDRYSNDGTPLKQVLLIFSKGD